MYLIYLFVNNHSKFKMTLGIDSDPKRVSGIQCIFQTQSYGCSCRNNQESKTRAGLHKKEKLMVTIPSFNNTNNIEHYNNNTNSRKYGNAGGAIYK